ncbi:cell envelope integrity protein CreD [Carboxylicivirga linearis]|uniref:Cell envelope integrity protein CreD n=1 Tax=Carboxylicivirga linearis TaxID=1628157 RepID=A0ABS5JQ94_9BACT|nr:cell envelope integrity protein CreD [Carboxylicivirga linearis]MBS2097038.1 cell envelope integrity protein CreD [Carboxylicivirga linearis]
MEVKLKTTGTEQWYQTITFKLVTVGLLILILLIPLSMVKSVIREREQTDQQVETEIMEQWGGPQIISGPILHLPVYYYTQDKNGHIKKTKKWLHIMPDDLNTEGYIEPHKRHRGIYETVIFNSQLSINGNFDSLNKLTIDADEVDWNKGFISLAITDNRGIKGKVDFKINNQLFEPEAGLISTDLATSGMSVKYPIDPQLISEKINFNITIDISGAKAISFNPIGKKTNINLVSSWKDPSFNGSFLPTKSQISDKGFEANWTITHLNRNFPQYWIGTKHSINENQLGVELYVPVNHYQKSLRSAKYGILIICLTLLVFLFIELVKKKTIQLLQYMLVGLALVLFFSILTALSEFLGFAWAYLAASASIILMVTLYSYGVLKDKAQALWVAALLIVLYTFLFVLLQLNDFAFLAGNIGLFVALAFIMKASTKIKSTNSSQLN